MPANQSRNEKSMHYKQSYASYHIERCGSFQELLDFLEKNERNNGIIVSYSRNTPREHTYLGIVSKIRLVLAGDNIQWITRSEGLRAKVAELVLSHNYGEAIPAILDASDINEL